MEQPKVIRKIQFRQGSYTITLPKKMVQILGIKRDQYVGIYISDRGLCLDIIHTNGSYGTEYGQPADNDSTYDSDSETKNDDLLDGLSM